MYTHPQWLCCTEHSIDAQRTAQHKSSAHTKSSAAHLAHMKFGDQQTTTDNTAALNSGSVKSLSLVDTLRKLSKGNIHAPTLALLH
jgi:hypothetical protein